MGGGVKAKFISSYCHNKSVLDIGVAGNSPTMWKRKNWLHGRLVEIAHRCVGIEIDKHKCGQLQHMGYDVKCLDAQNVDLKEKFEIIVAADIIEHLNDFKGFFESVSLHLEKIRSC